MGQTDHSKTYTVQPITSGDTEQIMDLLKRVFYPHEPLNETIELWSEDRPCPELDEYCQHSLQEGLTFKAVDPHGKIVGLTISGVVQINKDVGTQILKEADNCLNPKFQKILYILAQRDEHAKLWEKYPDDKQAVEVKVAATDPDWGKRGIMTKLVDETEKATKARGLRLLRMDTSSAYSAKAAEHLGFTCIYRALYTDIKRNGVPLIVPKAPHLEDSVYIKVLSS